MRLTTKSLNYDAADEIVMDSVQEVSQATTSSLKHRNVPKL